VPRSTTLSSHMNYPLCVFIIYTMCATRHKMHIIIYVSFHRRLLITYKTGNVYIKQQCGAFANHCYHGNATMHSLCIFIDLHVALNSTKVLPRKRNTWFPLHSFRAAKCLVLLSTILTYFMAFISVYYC
jgi:hypothetical protein